MKIRFANFNDAKDIFDLSNDKTVRQNAINQNEIIWEEHLKWLKNKLNSKDCLFYVAHEDNDLIGFIRLDKEDNHYVVSICINKKYRSKGIGTKFLSSICKLNTDKKLFALVKITNEASKKIFLNCGFSHEDFIYIKEEKYFVMILLPK